MILELLLSLSVAPHTLLIGRITVCLATGAQLKAWQDGLIKTHDHLSL